MPKVDVARLTGNYGSTLVAKRLSSECLVRPVAADTDVGVDLYCESLDDGEPFLHFWMQVKAGAVQVQENSDRTKAKCRFKRDHLLYWSRQPVPVFAAMVPVSWPVADEPNIYIADITSRTIMEDPPPQDSVTIESDFVWIPGNQEGVREFLNRFVPMSEARLLCREGVVAPVKTLRSQYTRAVPLVPAARYQGKILEQLRQTAAMSILSMWQLGQLGDETSVSRHRLRDVLAQFHDDGHWENFMAIGISAHVDREWVLAEENYTKAIVAVEGDPDFAPQPGIDGLQTTIRGLLQKARGRLDISA